MTSEEDEQELLWRGLTELKLLVMMMICKRMNTRHIKECGAAVECHREAIKGQSGARVSCEIESAEINIGMSWRALTHYWSWRCWNGWSGGGTVAEVRRGKDEQSWLSQTQSVVAAASVK
ncbi:hypothetical protein J6590_023261 [Homalodisca vitripennis]|nr:hypothetical protein J6590_023261 [Homalodisca vitripennis]